MSNSKNVKLTNKPTENIPMALEGFVSKLPMGYRDVYRDRREIANYNQDGSYFHALSEKEVLDKIFEKALELGLPIALEKSFRDNSDIYKGWQKNRKKNRLKASIKDVKLSGEVSEDVKNQEPPEVELKPNIHPLIEDELEELESSDIVFRPMNKDKTRLIVADRESRSIYYKSLRIYKSPANDEALLTVNEDTIIDVIFDNVKVSFQKIPGIPDMPRKVEFDAVSGFTEVPLHIGPCTDKEALQKLDQHGLILNQNRAPDSFKSVIQAYLYSGKAAKNYDAGVSGFFRADTGKMMSAGYSSRPVSKPEMRTALGALNTLSEKFPKERLGSYVKWSLISPFFYYLKQKGIYPRHYVMLGPTGTQKTAMGRIAPAIWGLFDIPSQDNGHFISGSRTDTPYRLGKSIGKSTFPAIIDEPKGLFSKDVNIELLKTATQNLVARETADGIYPAMNSIVLLTNVTLDNAEDILASRFEMVRTTFKDQIHFSTKEKEEFQVFQARTYPLLEPIGQYVAQRILACPEMLTADYEKIGTALLEDMYHFAELPVPDFVYMSVHVDTVEDINSGTLEQLRSYVVKTNLEAFFKNYGRVGILAENSRGEPYPQYDSMTNVSAEERITHSIKGGIVPWQIYKNTTGIEQVILTTAFAKEISKIVGESYNLQSIGELLGFEYKVSRIGETTPKTLVVSLDRYLKFLNPEIEDQAPDRTLQDESGKIGEHLRSLNPKNPELPENASTEEKKEKIEGPWKSPGESGTTAIPEEPEDKTDTQSHEVPSETGKIENAIDPVLRLLIDCTYNSSKKFKTAHELYRDRPLGTDWPEAFIHASLERETEKGTVIRKGTGYASNDVLEGRA